MGTPNIKRKASKHPLLSPKVTLQNVGTSPTSSPNPHTRGAKMEIPDDCNSDADETSCGRLHRTETEKTYLGGYNKFSY
jgi:hypothetical protein